ncbi:MAG: hypothetical protein AAB368_01745 [bacterium]
MGLFSFASPTRNTTQQSTTTLSDAFNTTANDVLNLSEVGTVSINLPANPDAAGKPAFDAGKLVPLALFGLLGLAAVFLVARKT